MRGLTPTDLPDLEALDVDAVLRHAGEQHGAGLVLLCSFQKEESVLVDAVSRVAPQTRIVTIDTGVLFPETLAAWKAFEDRFGVHVDVEDASRPGNPWTGPEDCCGAEKVAALERALSGASAWITGIRREQSPTRANAKKLEWDEKRGIPKYNPLADWTDKDLWNAHRRARSALPRAPRPGLLVDRLRAVHAAGRRPRGPLGRAGQDRVRPARCRR